MAEQFAHRGHGTDEALRLVIHFPELAAVVEEQARANEGPS